jgi:3'-phosphoadenosine 5'-phosphosulfate sulfotransferase (PAPS reductase)/FAD synthetase
MTDTARPSIDFTRLDGHERIVLQFSGGKDSLALLSLFKPHLSRMTVLHCDTSDQLPEMQRLVNVVEANVPSFRRVKTDAPAWIAKHGLPSDLVPIRCHPVVAAIHRDSGHPIVPFTDCCAANRWQPMDAAIRELRPSLVIHGQRRTDVMGWEKATQGDTSTSPGGWQSWAPIADWSDDQVMAYLREIGAPILPWYSHQPHAPECATCPASWGEKRAAYLRRHHPELAERYAAALRVHAVELAGVSALFMSEWRDIGEVAK